jgi:hypothetical protein
MVFLAARAEKRRRGEVFFAVSAEKSVELFPDFSRSARGEIAVAAKFS